MQEYLSLEPQNNSKGVFTNMKITILKRGFSFVLVFALISSVLALGAGAAELSSKKADVNSGIKITIDGTEFVPCDANGDAVDVFLYNGTTYLPVRAVSSLFSTGIMWDDANKVVYLGLHDNKPLPVSVYQPKQAGSPYSFASVSLNIYTGVGIYFNDELFNPTDANGEPVEPFLYNGTTYLPVRAISSLFGAEIDWDGANKTVLLSNVPEAVSPEQIIADASSLVKNYTDASDYFKEGYAYYLIVDETARQTLETITTERNANPGNVDLGMSFLVINAEYGNFKKLYGTYVETVMNGLNDANALAAAISEASADNIYNEAELSVISEKYELLKFNYTVFKDYIQLCTPEKIKEYVDSSFTTIKNSPNLTSLQP